MKLTHLRNLVAIAQRGGLRRAARHLGLAQPAVTRSIRELESELGVSLFERSTTGMVLTPIGEAFQRRCAAIQLELERACDEVKQMRGLTTGSISIGLSTAPHVALLPHVLIPFQARYPDVMLDIREGLFPAMESGVRDGTIDFYVGPLSEERMGGDFTREKLFDNLRVVMARPDHPFAGATSLKDLVDAKWVTTSVTANSDAELNPIFENHDLPAPRISAKAHSALSMISIAASSDLLAMLPQQWTQFCKKAGLLSVVPLQEELAAPPIYFVTRSSLPLTPAAEHFVDLIRKAVVNHILPSRD